jgi:hypothetical protein
MLDTRRAGISSCDVFFRPGLSVAGLMVVAVMGAGCPSSSAPSNCGLKSVQIPGNALTLLPGARLDSVGDSFVLLGTDGSDVRWARLGIDGQMGSSYAVSVPAHTNGPWFAVAGTVAAADHLVVAYTVRSAAGGIMDDLMTFAVPFDNPPSTPPSPMAMGQVPDVGSSPVEIAMVSGRGGMHAGLIWAVHGTTNVMARILDGNGRALAGDLTIAPMIGDFVCLRFSQGKEDMTIGFVDTSATPPNPMFVGTEITATGSALPSFKLPIGTNPTTECVEIAPTDVGYTVAWHSRGIGYYLGTYNSAQQFPSYLVLSDVMVSGPLPLLGGLGTSGKNYTLVFNHESGGEVWQINAMGQQLGGALVFPSHGHTGDLSTAQPAMGAFLYGTYADYPDPANKGVGQRFLERVSCP